MPEILRLAKGTLAEHQTFIGEKGEITLVCDASANRLPTGEVRVHDGVTYGGIPLQINYSDLINSPTVPVTLTDLGITDGSKSGQVLSTDGNGNFSFIDMPSGNTTTTTASSQQIEELTDQALIYSIIGLG